MDNLILVSGGTGFIGSHTCVALINAGYSVLILDNFSNSNPKVLDRLEQIVGIKPAFIKGDIRDRSLLNTIFANNSIAAVIHFASLKAVGESVEKPLDYYDNNVRGTIELLSAMDKANVRTLVFSSSATVYGNNENVPFCEHFARSATNPYGRSKIIIEDILEDLHNLHNGNSLNNENSFNQLNNQSNLNNQNKWNIARLRYFNPVGAHESGLIGENPNGIPNNLMPYITQVAVGRLQNVNIYGNDYNTTDGTGVRDYIHVMDLAEGHISALQFCQNQQNNTDSATREILTVNLGTGQGISVLQLIKAFEQTNQCSIQYKIMPRRSGDVAQCFADARLALTKLGWKTNRDIYQICKDSWNWQKNNPSGY